ncbi:DUF5074 domain-containing protein [Cytophaga sp. FL35]|uniref:YncE family protein n=1 Tax=Cytophaga sp. FL35 TaxID=1904456 RepID=UPI0016535C79|nr:DUF5074 domain-containing protein [Cytophaga sp. FL35]MBC6998641.1 YncE family protein [Cytophaga sp. FL35]
MKITKLAVLVMLSTLFFVSCSEDDAPEINPTPIEEETSDPYEDGLLVVNEGPFQNGSGTVTFISEDLSETKQAIFEEVNGEDLGNIVQSMTFNDSIAYIVVNNSHKIQVVNRYTFERVAVIDSDLFNPRYMAIANGKGYVTNWGDTADEQDDFVAIVDLETNSVVETLPVELGPETISSNEEYVYVAHQGAWGQNNKVSVIDPSSDTVLKTIEVGDLPNTMQWDASGSLWVLCSGAPSYAAEETNGSLVQIDVTANEINQTFDFNTEQHPGGLNIDGDKLYFGLDGGVYEFNIDATELPSAPYLENASFYSLTVKEGKLYGTDAKDYASQGDLLIYDLESKELINTLIVGVVPKGVYFN